MLNHKFTKCYDGNDYFVRFWLSVEQNTSMTSFTVNAEILSYFGHTTRWTEKANRRRVEQRLRVRSASRWVDQIKSVTRNPVAVAERWGCRSLYVEADC